MKRKRRTGLRFLPRPVLPSRAADLRIRFHALQRALKNPGRFPRIWACRRSPRDFFGERAAPRLSAGSRQSGRRTRNVCSPAHTPRANISRNGFRRSGGGTLRGFFRRSRSGAPHRRVFSVPAGLHLLLDLLSERSCRKAAQRGLPEFHRHPPPHVAHAVDHLVHRDPALDAR